MTACAPRRLADRPARPPLAARNRAAARSPMRYAALAWRRNGSNGWATDHCQNGSGLREPTIVTRRQGRARTIEFLSGRTDGKHQARQCAIHGLTKMIGNVLERFLMPAWLWTESKGEQIGRQ